jgi:integrase
VRLDAHTVSELTLHRRRQLEERLAEGLGGRADLVFTKRDGARLQPQHVSQAFEALVRRAGVTAIRLHDLRHTAATLALAAGIHPKVVSERLGHATVQLTLDTYSRVIDGIHEAAAEQLGKAILGDSKRADEEGGPSYEANGGE